MASGSKMVLNYRIYLTFFECIVFANRSVTDLFREHISISDRFFSQLLPHKPSSLHIQSPISKLQCYAHPIAVFPPCEVLKQKGRQCRTASQQANSSTNQVNYQDQGVQFPRFHPMQCVEARRHQRAPRCLNQLTCSACEKYQLRMYRRLVARIHQYYLLFR